MPEYKFMPDTPASEVIKAIQKASNNVCVDDSVTFHKASSSQTALDMAKNNIKEPSWAVWDLKILGKDTHPTVRKALLEHIKDPMMAFSLYISFDFWDDEEDAILKSKFDGKLPEAERELKDKIVTRAKEVH